MCFISLSLPCIRSCFFVGLSYHDCSLHKPSYCKWLQMYRFSHTCFDVGPRFKPKKKNGKLPQQLIIYAFFRPFFVVDTSINRTRYSTCINNIIPLHVGCGDVAVLNTEVPCHSRCDMLKNPHCSVAMSAEHSHNLQPYTGNGDTGDVSI